MTEQIKMPYQISTLPNGMVLQTMYNPYIHSVAVEAYVKVGSRYENINNNGISHVFEHMVFKGTTKRDYVRILEEIEEVGASINAATSYTTTTYNTKVLSEDAPIAIDLICDMLFNSTFPEEEFKKEKEVIIEELHQGNDDVAGVVYENSCNISYQNQALGRPIIGSIDNIQSFTREDLINFKNQYYVPENILFSVVGNIGHQEALELLESKCIAQPVQNSCLNYEPAKFTGGYIVDEKEELSHVHVRMLYESVNQTSPFRFAHTVFSNIVGGGATSRLFKEVRGEHGLVYSIGSGTNYNSDTGVFIIAFNTSPDKLNQSLSVIADVLKNSVDSITQEEVNKYKSTIKFGLLIKNEYNEFLASGLNKMYSVHRRYIEDEEVLENYHAVTIDDVQKAGRDILSSDFSVSIVGAPGVDIPSYDQFKAMFNFDL